MTNTEQFPNNHRPADACQVQHTVRPGVEARWYAVTKGGLATLCASERDALESADSFDVSYPHSAPHRAVLLGDVAAERERCFRLICDLRRRLTGTTAKALASDCAVLVTSGPNPKIGGWRSTSVASPR